MSSTPEAACRFCEIAETVPSWVLPHGDDVVSFKPFGALNTGHRMFVPVAHVVEVQDDPILTARCFEEASIWAGQKGKPSNLVVNSGFLAGQRVMHLHIHYVPRARGDGLGYRWEKDR